MTTIEATPTKLTWTTNDPDQAISRLIDANGHTIATIGITFGLLPNYVGVVFAADGTKTEVFRRARIGNPGVNAANYDDARLHLEILCRLAWIDEQLELTEAHIAASREALAGQHITSFLQSAHAAIRRHQKFIAAIWGS
jgi:hypothetical protein